MHEHKGVIRVTDSSVVLLLRHFCTNNFVGVVLTTKLARPSVRAFPTFTQPEHDNSFRSRGRPAITDTDGAETAPKLRAVNSRPSTVKPSGYLGSQSWTGSKRNRIENMFESDGSSTKHETVELCGATRLELASVSVRIAAKSVHRSPLASAKRVGNNVWTVIGTFLAGTDAGGEAGLSALSHHHP